MATYSIHIGEQTYAADSGQPLIDAIPSEQLVKGCLKGICRVCKCRLVSGCVVENGKKVALRSEFLPCISRAETDIAIFPTINSFHTSRLVSRTYLSDQVIEIVLDVKRVFYNSKSLVTLKHPGLPMVRLYSVVTLGKKNYDKITLHVKLRTGGIFSTLLTHLAMGEQLDYSISSPSLPSYDERLQRINIVAGGSGMGAALSRALELVNKHDIQEVFVCAINRTTLSEYHAQCLDVFSSNAKGNVNIINIPYLEWVRPEFDVVEKLTADALTIGVGSNAIIEKLYTLPLHELESFG